MKKFIQTKVRQHLNELTVDNEHMNPGMQTLCNTMSVKTRDDVLRMVTAAIGTQQQNPALWAKIAQPLSMLRTANTEIGKEKHTTYDGGTSSGTGGMTGDSMVDESNTWWAAIQSTLCEQGSAFV